MIAAVAGLALAVGVLIAVPGPSVIYLVGVALAHGRGTAVRGVFGNAVGTFSVGVIVAVGLGVLLTQYEFLIAVVRILGAVMLALIGVSFLRRARAQRPSLKAEGEEVRGRRDPFTLGIVVGFTNPKALIIFAAIVPSFLPDNDATIPLQIQLLIMSAVPVLLGVAIDLVWVEGAHRARSWFGRSPGAIAYFDAAAGVLMAIMALILAVEAATLLNQGH